MHICWFRRCTCCFGQRAVYARYAKQYISRSYVIGRDGRIAFQTMGYDQAEFDQLMGAVSKELARRP